MGGKKNIYIYIYIYIYNEARKNARNLGLYRLECCLKT